MIKSGNILPPPQTHSDWLRPSIIPQVGLCIGASCWHSHWEPASRRSRRCGGIDCARCARGDVPVIRYVLLLQTGTTEMLLELRKRHWLLLSEIQELYGSVVGAELRIYKQSPADNAPVYVDYLRFVPDTPERSISNLVNSLGLPPAFTREARTSTLPDSSEQEQISARLRGIKSMKAYK